MLQPVFDIRQADAPGAPVIHDEPEARAPLPFTYEPRRYTDASCNPRGTTGSKEAEGWDFAEPDEQPGLGRQTYEAMRALGGR